jgi:prolyl oligopeptidase
MTDNAWSRRRVVKTLGAGAVAAALQPLAARGRAASGGPPVARVEPVTDTLWGERIVDLYRWMENPKDPDWEPFMRAQAAYARAALDAIPARAALYSRISQLSGEAAATRAVQSSGGRIFYEKRPKGADNYKLFMRSGLRGAERLLIDPTVVTPDGMHVSLDWWLAAPNGQYVVYGLSPAGSENSVAHVLDVTANNDLPERIDRTQYANPSWLPDSSGFFFNRLAEGAVLGSVDYYKNSVSWLHMLRTDPTSDRKVLAHGQYGEIPGDDTDFPTLAADPSSKFVLASMTGGVRRENPYYTALLADVVKGESRWRRVCEISDEIVGAAISGDALYLVSTRGSPNGRVLKTSMAEPNLATAATVVPESKVVIDNISAARDALYLQDMDGGYGNFRRLSADGSLTAIPMPFDGSIFTLQTNTEEDGAYWVGSSWLVPIMVLHFDPATGRHTDSDLSPRPPIDLSRYEAIRGHATARDGTPVPLSIVARKGLARNGRNPTLVNAYGSYQIVNSPRFDPRAIAFLERGGVLATAHVRGGGEYGKRWWKAGQLLNKPNTWRDLIDCCENMIHAGWTSPAHLAIQGGSAGGITVGRAMTERPGLFAAVISNVGASNTLRAEFSQNGPPNVVEFGTVKEYDGFLALRQMDSLHAVRDGVPYPAVLLTTGLKDPRVEPWEVAKMAARLQKASVSGNPVLLRITFDAGHGLGSTRTQVDEQRADEYAFVFWRAGTAGFQPNSG